MCYGMDCEFESYPYGYNEGCVCRKTKYDTCPMDEDDIPTEQLETDEEEE